ncbi:MAG: BrnA antitoxin family protein [Acetobacteraceae bacterium]|nr:BrnA antitoxin family protein [Acetobacteraceae bacterium]
MTLSLDREVIDWFRQQGGDFRDRITEMLREHVRARRKDAA